MLGVAPVALALSWALVTSDLPPNLDVRVTNETGVRCPSEAAVRRGLAREMETVPMYIPVRRVVQLRLMRVKGRMVARIEVRDSDGAILGVRQIGAATRRCSELVDSAALALAVALQQTGRRPPPAKGGGGQGGGTPPWSIPSRAAAVEDARRRQASALPPQPVIATPRLHVPVKRPAAGPRFQGSVGIAAVAGPTPDLAPAGRATLELRWPSVSVGLLGQGYYGAVGLPSGGTAIKTRGMAAAVGCAHFSFVGLCAVLGGGVSRLQPNPDDLEPVFFFIGGARLAGELDLTRWLAWRVWGEVLGQNQVAAPTELEEVVYQPPYTSVGFGTSLVGRL